jgi:NAD(P)-dependent dehydrogenase (short-subunit alcohol dehydrogenase family)
MQSDNQSTLKITEKANVIDSFKLTEKFAVITGGGGFLAISHARALLRKECDVALWDLNLEKLETVFEKLASEFPNRRIHINQVDITNEKDVADLTARTLIEESGIDILINNAALNPKVSKSKSFNDNHFENFSLELWNLEVAVGLTGAILCSKHIGRHMAERGSGVILNIASDLSVIAPDQRIYDISPHDQESQFKKPVSYSVIKAGLVGLTKYLSTYWATNGVRVNALSPGGVFENQESEFVARLTNLIPMARMANQDEYIGAVQFLCSEASSYMTGQNIVIDGGRSVW